MTSSGEQMNLEEDYSGPERRNTIILTEEQIDAIAERAASKVLERFHLEVGKLTVRAVLYILGAACVVFAGWLGLEKMKL